MIGFTIVTNTDTLWLLYVAAFVLGMGETLFDTAAQSMMPSVVEKDDLAKANGRLYAVELTMNQFVGPPVGGLLAGLAIALAFAGSALAFAFAALALVARSRGRSSRSARDRADERRRGHPGGPAYLFHHRLLRTLAIMVGTEPGLLGGVRRVRAVRGGPGPMGLDELAFGIR